MPARYVSGSSFAGGHQVPFCNFERGSPLPMPLVGLFLVKYGEGPESFAKTEKSPHAGFPVHLEWLDSHQLM